MSDEWLMGFVRVATAQMALFGVTIEFQTSSPAV